MADQHHIPALDQLVERAVLSFESGTVSNYPGSPTWYRRERLSHIIREALEAATQAQREQPTCSTCRFAVNEPSRFSDMPLVCQASMNRADDRSLMAPTFDRRVPADYFCKFHEPTPLEATS